MQVVEAAARRALAAERAQQQAQQGRQATPKPIHDDIAPSTSGVLQWLLCLHFIAMHYLLLHVC